VRTLDGNLAVIPNKTVANAAVTNITLRPSVKTVMNLTLPHDLPATKVKQAISMLSEICRGNPLTEDVLVSFNQFSGRNLNLLVTLWTKGADQKKYLAALQEINLAVKERFDAEGIGLV
jgi:small-conductance mechanosensitive channel